VFLIDRHRSRDVLIRVLEDSFASTRSLTLCTVNPTRLRSSNAQGTL
jgi:hypothetical protein